ncbi:hypothetical protein MRS44_003289 [Fusarium solani]|nr:hypothetical protein MRS44_003289 [Fusarium solani]
MRPIPWKASCQDEDQDQIQNSNLEKAARDKDSWPTRLALPLLLAPTQILTYGQQGIPWAERKKGPQVLEVLILVVCSARCKRREARLDHPLSISVASMLQVRSHVTTEHQQANCCTSPAVDVHYVPCFKPKSSERFSRRPAGMWAMQHAYPLSLSPKRIRIRLCHRTAAPIQVTVPGARETWFHAITFALESRGPDIWSSVMISVQITASAEWLANNRDLTWTIPS